MKFESKHAAFIVLGLLVVVAVYYLFKRPDTPVVVQPNSGGSGVPGFTPQAQQFSVAPVSIPAANFNFASPGLPVGGNIDIGGNTIGGVSTPASGSACSCGGSCQDCMSDCATDNARFTDGTSCMATSAAARDKSAGPFWGKYADQLAAAGATPLMYAQYLGFANPSPAPNESAYVPTSPWANSVSTLIN